MKRLYTPRVRKGESHQEWCDRVAAPNTWVAKYSTMEIAWVVTFTDPTCGLAYCFINDEWKAYDQKSLRHRKWFFHAARDAALALAKSKAA